MRAAAEFAKKTAPRVEEFFKNGPRLEDLSKHAPRFDDGKGAVIAARMMGASFFLIRCGIGGWKGIFVSLGMTAMEWAISQQLYLTGMAHRRDLEAWRERCGNLEHDKQALQAALAEVEKLTTAREKDEAEIAKITKQLADRRARNFDLAKTTKAAIAHVLEGYQAGITSNRALQSLGKKRAAVS